MTRTRSDLNALAGIVGIFLLGIFLTWFPLSALGLPLPRDPAARTAITGAWQFLCTVVMPYAWASSRLGLSPARLGLTRAGLGRNLLWGGGLYALSLIAFLGTRNDPIVTSHPTRILEGMPLVTLVSAMCITAAGTDLATRGFVLLALVRHGPTWFAVVMQNAFWLVGHTREIAMLSTPLGNYGALAFLAFVGVAGDVIALKTRNVVGLALAHAVLNIAMVAFMRGL